MIDGGAVEPVVAELLREHNGLKHVWHSSGWPFPDRSKYNEALLRRRGQRVIVLTRRNILRRVVSSQVSEQTRIWSLRSDHDRRRLQEHRFDRLDAQWIASQLEIEHGARRAPVELLRRDGAPFMELWYEDLYERPAPDQQRQLARVFAFLSCEPPDGAEATARVERLLDPERSRMSSAAVYRRIPGIDEIEARFGSDANGWLFR